ncbi:MAG: GAF domain-containing sensor histidine kinase [Pyrinomonadaceae bacterium]
MKNSADSNRSLLLSFALSALAALFIYAFWAAGILARAEKITLFAGGAERAPVRLWLGAVMLFLAGVVSGVAIERIGLRRAAPYIGSAIFVWLIAHLIGSRFLQLDLLFLPLALAVLLAVLLVQIKRLWMIDSVLGSSIRRVAAQVHALEGGAANSRMQSSLRLLQIVLPLDEAVIFQPGEDGVLNPAAARLRATNTNPGEANRNAVWRAGVGLCERAIKFGEIQSTEDGAGTGSSVAVPLKHEEGLVGALLVRLREPFDPNDGPLLLAVGAQMARNFHRDETRRKAWVRDFWDRISVRAARHRLASFGVVEGLLTEQRFGAEVLATVPEAHAVAYLDGTLAYVNKPMLTLARLSEEQGRKIDLFELLDCFRVGVFDEPAIAVRRVLQTGENYARDLNYAYRNQTLALSISLVSGRALGSEDATRREPLCIAVSVRDVTQLKEYDRLKSDMTSLMSHELRTPITSINGFAELLALDDGIPEESREFATIIASESQRLSRMIDTFLSITKLEMADKLEVMMIPLRMDEVVRDTVESFQPAARKKRIRLVEQSSDRIPPVAADKSLMTKAIGHLIGNAIKYSPERTTVTVSTTLEADSVRVVVEDRGYGIPAEAIDKIWQKFYRVVRDGQEKDEESTGLGLSIVKEIAEQHGGAVVVESEVDQGSTFSFTLPRL